MRIVTTATILALTAASAAWAAPAQKQAGCDRVCHPKVQQYAHDPIVAMNRWFGNVGPDHDTRLADGATHSPGAHN